MALGDKKRTARKSSSVRATTRSTSSSGGSVTAVVLLDSYGWHDDHTDPTSPRNDAVKGEKITVSAAEFKRSQEMKPRGLAKSGSDKAKAAESGDDVTEEPPLTKPDGDLVDPDADAADSAV